jgi:hypothetical protein
MSIYYNAEFELHPYLVDFEPESDIYVYGQRP